MIRVFFNRKRQWIDVHFHEVSPETFHRKNKTRWGYYVPESERDNKHGKFGEIHLVESRVRDDLVAHELFHVLADFVNSRELNFARNEERLATLMDELTRNFWREYAKYKKS